MFKAIILMDRNGALSRINWELFWVSTRRFWGRIRKLKIWFEWRLILITIKAESRLYEGCISGYASLIFILLLPEIDRINQRFGFNGRWSFWYFWRLRLKCINIHQSEFIGDDFLRKYMEIWGKYNRRMHDDQARSYKNVVINCNSGRQSKDKDGRDYYWKGKGKAFEAPESKWVKAAERGQRRPSNHHGYYKGDCEGSRHKSLRREDGRHGATAARTGIQEAHKEAREDGEIRNTGEDDTLLPSLEFQLELAKTQAEGTDVILESTDEDNGLQMEDQADDLEMKMDAINATLLENGVDMEVEEEFQTLSEEEAEQAELASRAQEEQVHTQEEKELMPEEADMEKGKGAGELALRQGSRKRLLKPSIITAGSNKMRAANALVSPRRKAAAKSPPLICTTIILAKD
ncbi:hypothetical protein HID58_055523 [Brassica napus]|uniref:Uncharacterized protein n=1 Tax=Brassica napus TaxID=3708 RepID=A0ABQ8AKL0_BRANA|nr:hypothetical protein HID58_055523 [Brassica napus]